MPLLPLEPFVFPDDLLTRPPAAADDQARWWVLGSRPRAEKQLARRILAKSIPFFLPLAKRVWRSRGRYLTSYSPLFPGYVFLCGDADARLEALRTNLVAYTLAVEDQPQLLADLERVHRLIVSGIPLTPEKILEPGTLVEVSSGPFEGLQGKVVRRQGRWRLVVEVRFIHQGVSVEIDRRMVTPVGQDTALALAGGR
jgi:transcriptional antiterminator RfaH